jgi:hypothetical protein
MVSLISNLADLRSLCDAGVAEGLQLEFKLKEDPSTAEVGKSDKRAIAEVVSSFANSEGGTLLYGVRSQRRDGADVAVELVPIQDIDRFLNQFRMVCSLNISPELSTISIRAIREGEGTAGYLVCHVERSDRRPHMSTAPGVHSYYRRSFEGSALMTPSEIRDQHLAVRDAVVLPELSIGGGGSYATVATWVAIRTNLVFALQNVGVRTCINPYLRVAASCPLHSYGGAQDPQNGGWKTDFTPGTLIHVEDRLQCLSLGFVSRVDFSELQRSFASNSADWTNAIRIYPGDDDPHSTTIGDKVRLNNIALSLRYGAENASLVREERVLSAQELARGVLKGGIGHIRERTLHQLGTWRQDLASAFLAGP